ncbi:MAG: hypothetical protein LBU36_01890 [Clostridiales bacterium]|jgi:type II pantothenate kinase|nr:hypothetical protein [Clostridiales bacterium]
MIAVGVDFGISSFKTAAIDLESGFLRPPAVLGGGAEGALSEYLSGNALSPGQISRVNITGIRAPKGVKTFLGAPAFYVSEFESNARGAMYLSDFEEAVVACVGSGTSLLKCGRNGEFTHLGGTGVGGAAIAGLSRLMLGTDDFNEIARLAAKGDLSKIDLTIGDLAPEHESLRKDVTAANFGKIAENAGKPDVALAVLNLVFQTVGMMCVFAARSVGAENITLIGGATDFPQAPELFYGVKRLCGLNFYMPEKARFATAIGAALCERVR